MRNMGRKRKSSSPEVAVAQPKLRKDPVSVTPLRALFSQGLRRTSTPTRRKDGGLARSASPRRQSPRFKCQSSAPDRVSGPGEDQDCDGEAEQQCSTPLSSPLCPEDDTELGLVITLDEDCEEERPQKKRRPNWGPMKRGATGSDVEDPAESPDDASSQEEQTEEAIRKLDRDLEIKSRQHNLTPINVCTILHEVITNEHVVAMMKAAIRETQNMPLFEPKMTRSKLKEVVEKGVGVPAWNISPIKTACEPKPPQFVDIPLEEEDSSDEEYCPEDDEEDETAEDTFFESDVDSSASSPRVSRRARSRTPLDSSECEDDPRHSPIQVRASRHLRVDVVPMGPPPPPAQAPGSCWSPRGPESFMEKLHAVDEELELSPICMDPFQTLGGGGGGGGGGAENSLVACRTRSKRPLRNVPLGQLEAELHAPDITPDMYDCGSAHEDRDWTDWLKGLMISDVENEEEGDDDDDPEYNFLEDLDEPDLEDYRNDRAVRITKKEVNELMDELFETFRHEVVGEQEVTREDDEEKDDPAPPPSAPTFNVPQAIRFEEPLAHMLTACRRSVRPSRHAHPAPPHNAAGPQVVLVPQQCALVLSAAQRLRLQQHIQQHVQLLTQTHMLSAAVAMLQSEASTTQLCLTELQSLAARAEGVRAGHRGYVSVFRVCNLQSSLQLLEEVERHPSILSTTSKPTRPNAGHSYPLLPPQVAWLMATRPPFLYPELLPHCSLDPARHPPRTKPIYPKGEDGLIVLGLKHFRLTEFPYQLMSRYLIPTKRPEQLRLRVRDLCATRAGDNIIKCYCQHKAVPPLPVACLPVTSGQQRPPVEREETVMPNWLRRSLPYIHQAVLEFNQPNSPAQPRPSWPPLPPPYVFPGGTRYPPALPEHITLRLHPIYKPENRSHLNKPRPIYGFARPALAPLVKAPAARAVGPVNVVTTGPALPSSQGVILLAQTPCTPLSGALPFAPVHGTVPLGIQYVDPETGCVAMDPVTSLPPTVLQIPPVATVATPLLAPGVVATCVVPSAPIRRAEPLRRRLLPQRLVPIRPAPQRPTESLADLLPPPSGAGPGTLHPHGTAPPPAFITNTLPLSLAADSVGPKPALEGFAKPCSLTPPPEESALSHPSVPLHQRAPLPPSLSSLPTRITPRPPGDIGQSPRSSPLFFTRTPSPPPARPAPSPPPLHRQEHVSMEICPAGTKEETKEHSVVARPLGTLQNTHVSVSPSSEPLGYQQNLLLNPSVPVAAGNGPAALHLSSVIAGSLAPPMTPATSPAFPVLHASLSDNPQFLLVQSVPDHPPQLVLVSKNCLMSDRSGPLPAGGPDAELAALWQQLGDFLAPPGPAEGPRPPAVAHGQSPAHPPLLTAQTKRNGGEGWTEDEEGGEEDAADGSWAGGRPVDGLLLTLSESSGSPCSSLESRADALERLLDEENGEGAEEQQPDARTRAEEGGRGGETSVGDEGDVEGESREPGVPLSPATVRLSGRHPGPEPHTLGQRTEPQDQTTGGGEEGSGGEREEGGGGGEEQGDGDRDRREDGNRGEEQGGGQGGGAGGGERDGDGEKDGDGGEERDSSGERDGDGERERPGEEEEDEDFDDLTQDEDEEEVMSSASEESVLSVPELQETMEKLTWLASERRSCGVADSEEDNSPTSPTSPTSPPSPASQNSQEENSEEEEEGAGKGEESEVGEGDINKLPEGGAPQEDDPPQANGKAAGRGRGRPRPPRSLRRGRRQERGSKDTSKLRLLYDDRILDNDPQRESKDIAFAQAYLSRVRDALLDSPGQMEEFLRLLYEFERSTEGGSAVALFAHLKPLLSHAPQLLRDFAAFLLPSQALECGLFEEQQAFERSRRFLRQLEISFGENPTHYQKIVRALQGGPGLSSSGMEELKAQMSALLKGHTHLQGEFWLFFEELRPPPARPGQFEEAVWPEEGGGGPDTGEGLTAGPWVSDGFEEVTLPDLEEEEEAKIPPMTGRSRRRKDHEKDCDWPDKDCPCHCHDNHEGKHRRHRRKGCPRCHSNKGTDVSKAMKSREPSDSTAEALAEKGVEEKDEEKRTEREEERDGQKERRMELKEECGSGGSSPQHAAPGGVQESGMRAGEPASQPEEQEEEAEEERDREKEGEEERDGEKEGEEDQEEEEESSRDEACQAVCVESPVTEERAWLRPPRPNPTPTPDPPVCAKNISLTPSGEKVILWTREADRVILTACQQQGANQNTFQAVSVQLGNKTANEVSRRFRDLMRLFHTSARQEQSEEEEHSNAEQRSATDEEQD